MKRINRFKQQANEALGRGEKTDKLTQKLAVVEKKVEGIRNAVQSTTKKLSGTIQGSGASVDKHQRKLPQYTLGIGMMEHGTQLGTQSLFGSVLQMVGQAQQDIASQLATYEITIVHDIIAVLNNMLEEDMKTVDKCKKKLGTARLDMDSARTRLRNLEQQMERSTREYNMEKLTTLRTEVDEFTRKFEECQDAYATSMYEFISKEQQYTDKIQQLVKLQITNYKNAAVQLEGMLPIFEKKMNETQDRPVFGLSLVEHLRISKRDIAAVLETCCNGLRKEWMDTEGLFRIAGGQSKVKFLKTAFDAGQFDVSTHDPHTIAGCLKMYLRELPEPLLTYELYTDWMKGTGVNDEQVRKKNLWAMKERLPEPNLNNFRYLIGFLYEFAQYADITKMSVNNIAIVIGPNLLWPKEENADPTTMVTETTLQRCLTETFIEHCHYFFPDLPEPSSASKTTSTSSNLTFTATSPTSSSSPTSLQSYTSKSPEFFAPQLAPVSTSEDSVSNTSAASTASAKPKEDLPHPLADSAIDEGVTVVLDSNSSPSVHRRNSPSPSEGAKSRSLPRSVPPIPAPRTGSSNNLTPPESPSFSQRAPPSPAPRNRGGTGSSSSGSPAVGGPEGGGGEGTHNGRNEGGGDHHPATPPRPTPPARSKRPTAVTGGGASSTPPTPAKPPPYSFSSPNSGTLERKHAGGNTPGNRAPIRKAPPPPKSRKPTHPDPSELTSL